MTLSFQKTARLSTKRLVIKPYDTKDLNGLIALLTNAEITRTFMVPKFDSFEQAEEMAKRLIAFSQAEDGKHLEYGIYLEGRIIGFINDCGINEDEIEIGYVIHPDYQGKGYATEAVQAILCELRRMGFHKVRAAYFVENTASRRVMEKCGMHRTDAVSEEEYRGQCRLCHYCEITFSQTSDL